MRTEKEIFEAFALSALTKRYTNKDREKFHIFKGRYPYLIRDGKLTRFGRFLYIQDLEQADLLQLKLGKYLLEGGIPNHDIYNVYRLEPHKAHELHQCEPTLIHVFALAGASRLTQKQSA